MFRLLRASRIAAVAFAVLALSACTAAELDSTGTTITSFVANTAVSLSTSAPTDITDYVIATNAATLAHNTADFAALNASTLHLNKAALQQIDTLNDAVHVAWLDLKAAHDKGQSLDFAAIQAAFDAYEAYRAKMAIPEQPAPTPITS